MGTATSKIYDEIKLHGSWEAYVEFRDIDLKKGEALPDQGEIPYFPDPEVVPNTAGITTTVNMLYEIVDYNKKEKERALKIRLEEISNSWKKAKSGKRSF